MLTLHLSPIFSTLNTDTFTCCDSVILMVAKVGFSTSSPQCRCIHLRVWFCCSCYSSTPVWQFWGASGWICSSFSPARQQELFSSVWSRSSPGCSWRRTRWRCLGSPALCPQRWPVQAHTPQLHQIPGYALTWLAGWQQEFYLGWLAWCSCTYCHCCLPRWFGWCRCPRSAGCKQGTVLLR